MMTAVSHTDDDGEIDIRAAARREARREGRPLGEWLDGIMAERAAALGLALADLDPNQRIEAVMLRLGRARPGGGDGSPAPSFKPRAGDDGDSLDSPLGDRGPNREAHQDLRRDGMTAAALKRESLEDPTMTEDGSAVTARNADDAIAEAKSTGVPHVAERAAQAVSRQAKQRGEIESKLSALFKALDRTPRRGDHGNAADGDSFSEQRMDALLGQTAISPSWRLDKAVGEIAQRQALLENQAAAEGIPASAKSAVPVPRGAPRAAAEDLRRQYERPSPESRVPARHPASSVPSLFTSLQGDIARLAKRLDAVHQDVSRREPSRSETSFEQIRSLLDDMRPDASIDMLGRSVEALSVKLDTMNAARVAPEAISKLAQRIEDVHAEVSARLSAPPATPAVDPATLDKLARRIEDVHAEVAMRLSASPAAPVVDMVAIEQMIRDLVERADRPAQEAPDMRGLEEAVQDLAAKLDRAERSTGGAELLAGLQAQVGTLAKRLDKSDAGLMAIVAMERSLGEIFTQMGEMREAAVQAAESTAQVAAQEAIRASMAEINFGQRSSPHASDAAVEQVTQELADMRAGREEADRRLHAILAALNTSLERVVDRLGSLEDEAAQGRLQAVEPSAGPIPAAAAASGMPADPRAGVSRPLSRAAEPLDLDVPLEPRTVGRYRKAPVSEAVTDLPPPVASPAPAVPDPTSFIAAARRAAQAATADQAHQADEARAQRRGTGLAADPEGSQRVKTAMLSRRRPWLLALASLVVLAGAAEVVRLGMNAGEPGVSAPAGDPTATTPPHTPAASPAIDNGAANTIAPVDAAPAGKPQSALPDAGPDKTATAPAAEPAEAADAAPVIAAPPAPAKTVAAVSDPVVPVRSLPMMAMGPAANVAAVQAADLAARAAVGGVSQALRTQADGGNAAAQFELGLRYADGRGVARDGKTAAVYFEKAARQGLAPAAYRLGSLYEKGLGVTRDAAQSVSWYQKAAEAGNVRAMHNLAVMLAEGAAGKADYTTAAAWFTKAAEAGVRDSQYNLAILYARGMGVEQSLAHSYTWFAIAAANGDTDSVKKRDDVAARLDAGTLAGAKKAAEEFKPAPQVAAANDVQPPAGGWDAVQTAKPASSGAAPKAADGKLSRL